MLLLATESSFLKEAEMLKVLPEIARQRPNGCILLLDALAAHFTEGVVTAAANFGILLLKIPPTIGGRGQPADNLHKQLKVRNNLWTSSRS